MYIDVICNKGLHLISSSFGALYMYNFHKEQEQIVCECTCRLAVKTNMIKLHKPQTFGALLKQIDKHQIYYIYIYIPNLHIYLERSPYHQHPRQPSPPRPHQDGDAPGRPHPTCQNHQPKTVKPG